MDNPSRMCLQSEGLVAVLCLQDDEVSQATGREAVLLEADDLGGALSDRGQSVVVTINDRGPFIRGRVLDLSTGAARAIGLTGAGVGRVTAEVVS